MATFETQTRLCGCVVQVQISTNTIAEVIQPCPEYARLRAAVVTARERSWGRDGSPSDDEELTLAGNALDSHLL